MNVPSQEWKEEYIQGLIDAEVEESINLDYKACDALQRTEGKKKDISKDVSAFANSMGGEIIYGVKEYDDVAKRHLPETIDSGFDQSEISKEWLERVINSNIQPRIEGLIIHSVSLSGDREGKYIYVVSIPQSHTAHQAKDLRYYKRYNFESVPMEDYEIRDVMNRRKAPSVDLILNWEHIERKEARHEYYLNCTVVNNGHVLINNWALYFAYPKRIIVDDSVYGYASKGPIENLQFYNTSTYLEYWQFEFRSESGHIFYPGTEIIIFDRNFSYYVDNDIHKYDTDYIFYWSLFADDMTRKDGFRGLNECHEF